MNHLMQGVLAAEPSVWLVALLGILVVFIGLVAIVGIVLLMNRVCELLAKKCGASVAETPAAPAAPLTAANTAIPNRQEILAAVCAAVAEENGTDISAIRVISFKKL